MVLLPLLRPPLRPRIRASLSRSCRHRRPPLRYCRSNGRCPFIADAVARARACRYGRSTGRCLYITAAAAECIAVSRICDAAACIVIECCRDGAAWTDRRRIAGLL